MTFVPMVVLEYPQPVADAIADIVSKARAATNYLVLEGEVAPPLQRLIDAVTRLNDLQTPKDTRATGEET